MMEIPDMTIETTVVKTDDGQYTVKVYVVTPLTRMHAMDMGPVATEEQAESLATAIRGGEDT